MTYMKQMISWANRDHSSVLNAARRGAELRDRDPAFRRLTDKLIRHFRDLQED